MISEDFQCRSEDISAESSAEGQKGINSVCFRNLQLATCKLEICVACSKFLNSTVYKVHLKKTNNLHVSTTYDRVESDPPTVCRSNPRRQN